MRNHKILVVSWSEGKFSSIFIKLVAVSFSYLGKTISFVSDYNSLFEVDSVLESEFF